MSCPTSRQHTSWSGTSAEQRDQHRQRYVSSVLPQYCRLSATTGLVCHRDRRTAVDLFQGGVPLDAVEAAFRLETVRRSLRSPHAPPLQPIRSLRYFNPIINQVLTDPPDLGPLHYLSFKIESLADLRLGFPLRDPAF